MRNRIIAAVLLAAVLVTGLGAALASPGTAEDPFVTLNYLTKTYYAEMELAMLEQAQAGTAQVEKSALDKLAELSAGYLAKARPDGKLYSDTFLYLALARDDVLTLYAGSGLQFDAGVVALLHLIANVEDTNLHHRGGEDGAAWAAEAARELLKVSPYPQSQQLEALDDSFIARNLSPGGCADLLAVTYFLHSLEQFSEESQSEG